jgi:hypothetical protein
MSQVLERLFLPSADAIGDYLEGKRTHLDVGGRAWTGLLCRLRTHRSEPEQNKVLRVRTAFEGAPKISFRSGHKVRAIRRQLP